ncbi:MAG TPA: FAD-dependent oxidoreductase, partial [Thermoanaerobaculia bacterium]|nr:FAD-dependent oxidoreductase [Thermoanaerobaculia bacterium]
MSPADRDRYVRVARFGIQCLAELVSRHAIECDWDDRGYLRAAAGEEGLRALDRWPAWLDAVGTPYRHLDAGADDLAAPAAGNGQGHDAPPAAGDSLADWLPGPQYQRCLRWLRDLAATLAEDHAGQAPPTQAWTPEQQQFTGTLLRCVEDAATAYQAATFSPRRAARALGDLAAAAAGFADRELPWRGLANRREERNTGVALQVLAVKVLAVTAYPLLPAWSARLWSCVGDASPLGDGGAAAWEDTPGFVPTGSPIRGLAELAAPGAGSPRG